MESMRGGEKCVKEAGFNGKRAESGIKKKQEELRGKKHDMTA